MAKTEPTIDRLAIARKLAERRATQAALATPVVPMKPVVHELEEVELAPLLLDEPMDVPEMPGTIIAWRAWRVEGKLPDFGVPPRMYSVAHGDYFWPHRQHVEALCSKDQSHVPGQGCSCGLYAAKSRSHLLSLGYPGYAQPHFTVIGEVAMWGKVIEGSKGWRAQYSYPRRLFVPYEAHHLVKPLMDGYGVPVRLDNWLTENK